MQITDVSDFGWLARQLFIAARSAGMIAPGFRSPPSQAGRTRTVRRYDDGSALVSVKIKHRSRTEVIEGIIVANRLTGGVADAARRTLARCLSSDLHDAA